MANEPDFVSGFLSRNRVVYIHSRGKKRFLGGSSDESAPEVTVEDIEALTSAGFDIVEFNMSDGKPLCAALLAAPTRTAAVYHNHSRPTPFQDHPQLEITETRIRLGLDFRRD